MRIDNALLARVAFRTSGASAHAVANAVGAYRMAAEAFAMMDDMADHITMRKIFERQEKRLRSFCHTGTLPDDKK